MRIYRNACFCSNAFDLLDIAVQVRTSLRMNGNNRRPGLHESFHIFLRFNYHQMNIQRLFGMLV